MSIIEKAVQRLDQLKQASAETPAVSEESPAVVAPKPAVKSLLSEARPLAGADAASAPPQGITLKPATDHPTRVIEIDLGRLAKMGMVTPDRPKSTIAEEFRVIKRPLISNAKGHGAAPIAKGNLIMVTSSLPGEGKSFSAINLAVSMAMELDFTVLLVDADFSRPSVLPRLGLPAEKGLMDVLVGEVPDLRDVMLRTNIEKLTILPAGMPHARATELIASEAMARLLAEMASRYPDRIIVFDSPPLLATTEARVLATHMGQILVVVEAERTTHGAVTHALSTIEECPVKMMILNKSRGQTGGLYGYGYGYGYGSDTRTETPA